MDSGRPTCIVPVTHSDRDYQHCDRGSASSVAHVVIPIVCYCKDPQKQERSAENLESN